jgi:hypothetical protein
MNMNTWIAEREKQHLAQIAIETERQLMWGDNSYKRNALRLDLADLYKQGKVDLAEQKRIMDMIDSPAGEDLTFAEILIETISTQKSIQHVSNIYSGKSQISELRS